MQLLEAISGLTEGSADSFIFAERIAGRFRPESEALVIELSESDLCQPTSVVAAQRAPGMEYFLESSIVLGMLEEWGQQGNEQQRNINAIVQRVIHYAENDA